MTPEQIQRLCELRALVRDPEYVVSRTELDRIFKELERLENLMADEELLDDCGAFSGVGRI